MLRPAVSLIWLAIAPAVFAQDRQPAPILGAPLTHSDWMLHPGEMGP